MTRRPGRSRARRYEVLDGALNSVVPVVHPMDARSTYAGLVVGFSSPVQ
jgi:hypothetical protein